MSKQKIVVVAGPTASGKTGLGVLLAKEFQGEIVSADSMQVYRGFSILSAKPTLKEQGKIKHHLIDFLPEEELFSVADYTQKARVIINELKEEGTLPIVVGGTGLYIDSLLNNFQFKEEKEGKLAYRKALLQEAERSGDSTGYLFKKLQKLDPEIAKTIHPNNKIKVIRAIEICETKGITMGAYQKQVASFESEFDYLYLVLTYKDRNLLYEKINRRVDIMVQEGLVEEARKVYLENKANETAKAAIGYKEFIPYFQGNITLTETVEAVKQGTRRYAKRQMTWFRRHKEAVFLEVDTLEGDLNSTAKNFVKEFLYNESKK